ncbi:elongation factor P [bacterium]|nr:elongation factor P [bacterium]
MITPNDFRTGTTFKKGNDLLRVIEFQHVKPGKGPAFVRVKLLNVRSGSINEVTMRTEEKLEDVRIEKREMTFLYRQGESYIFMDSQDYDQVTVQADILGEKVRLIRENDVVFIDMYEDEILGVDLPASVVLKVVQTEPGVKGDTATAATKAATLETGAVVQVPLFIEEGDMVKVDTRAIKYLERVRR